MDTCFYGAKSEAELWLQEPDSIIYYSFGILFIAEMPIGG